MEKEPKPTNLFHLFSIDLIATAIALGGCQRVDEETLKPGEQTTTVVFSAATTESSKIFESNMNQPRVIKCSREVDEHGLTKKTDCIFKSNSSITLESFIKD